MERPSEQRRQRERRRLWDRRAPDPRRASDDRRRKARRSEAKANPSERRARSDRRSDERRSDERRIVQARRRGRRRKDDPTPFTSEQMTELRKRFGVAGPVSCPACGSAFTLGPGRRRGAEMARRVMCLGCGRAAVIPNTRAARVLLVDQNRERRNSLQSVLAEAGHEVIEVADALVALHAYQSVPADVVFIDALAPGRIEAPEFLRRLRRVFPDARVVAMAARPSYTGAKDQLAVSQGMGAVRTIRMPCSRDDVLRTVEEVRP